MDSRHRPLAGLDVLLLEDREDHRQVLQILLECTGAAVIVAATASEVRSILGGFRPDVVVTDMHLGRQDWLSLLHEAMHRENHPPFLAVSAEDVDRQRVRQLGFVAHVRKPVDPGLFVEAVLSAVDEQRAVQRSSW